MPQRVLSKGHFRSIWTNSSFATIVGRVPMAAFQTLLGLGTGHKPTSYEQIRGAGDLPKLSAEG